MKVFIAESVTPENFYERDWDGKVAEESLRINKAIPYYRIVMTRALLARAAKKAADLGCDLFHLSCHGNSTGICLTDETRLKWDELAKLFQPFASSSRGLILSSCIGGDHGVAHAFANERKKMGVIFGSEADDDDRLHFPGACIAWPILYTELAHADSIGKVAFKRAVKHMNAVTHHSFVYRRWDHTTKHYRRYPSKGNN